MPKPDASARKMEFARNPKSADIVVSSDDDKFLDQALGKEDDDFGVKDEEIVEVTPDEVSADEVSAIEEKLGRKLTEEEKAELSNIKKEDSVVAEIPEDFELIKPEDLPKELQPHFKRMLASFTRKMQGISEVNRKAELFDFFSSNPVLAQRLMQPAEARTTAKVEAEDTVSAEDSFVQQLNLPEENELTPAIRAMAKIMVKGFGEIRSDKQSSAENEIKRGVKSYFDQNPSLTKDRELCVMMDRLGIENPSLYNNMPRLRKFAEAELGRPAIIAIEEAKTNLAQLYKAMKDAKKSSVSKPSVSTERGATGKTKNIEEAFERALTRVRLKYGKK